MRNALPKRLEKPFEIEPNTRIKAKVLRFDRRHGIVLTDRAVVQEEPSMPFCLVRDLLVFLRILPPVANPPRGTMRKKSSKGSSQ